MCARSCQFAFALATALVLLIAVWLDGKTIATILLRAITVTTIYGGVLLVVAMFPEARWSQPKAKAPDWHSHFSCSAIVPNSNQGPRYAFQIIAQ